MPWFSNVVSAGVVTWTLPNAKTVSTLKHSISRSSR